MTLIVDVIRPELSKLPALELEKIAIFDLVYTLAFANINQSSPNLVSVCTTIRSQMSFIMDIMGLEHKELFALE